VLAGVANLVRRGRPATARAVASQLQLPVNTVRFHLTRLVADGALVADTTSLWTGRGRPPQAYRPRVKGSDQAGMHSYELMAAMLAGVVAAHVPDAQHACLEVGQGWGRFLASPTRPDHKSPDSAVADLTRVLTALGFDPQVSADRSRVDIFNCPFQSVAEAQQKVACTLHLGLMRGVLDGTNPALTVQRLDAFVQPGLCVAHLGGPEKRAYPHGMSDVLIYHNPNCPSSVNAVRVAAELGVEHETVNYLKNPPTADQLREIIAKLVDPPTNLVRRDATFTKLGLTDADVATEDQIVAVLVQHKRLLQRPVLVTADTAIIGRPKGRVAELLS
jgi:arsenate reductase (glutaredoxin)